MGKKKKIALGILAAFVIGMGGCFGYVNLTYKRDFSSTPMPSAIKASGDPKVIAHGAYVVNAIAHCAACHGNGDYTNKHELPPDPKDLRGGYILKAGPFGTFYPTNLTPDPDTGIAKLSDGELARIIRHGVGPRGDYDPLMAFAVGPMSDEDLTAVISYLRSLPPIKSAVPADQWGFVAKALSGRFNPRMTVAPTYVPPAADEPSKERGEYLANGPAVCFGCHTPIDQAKGFLETGPRFSGAARPDRDALDPNFEVHAPNLTPDPETGAITSFTEDAFVDRFKKVGAITHGSQMPWDNFKQMTDGDLKSIFRYLKSLPPTKHATGPSRRKRGWKPADAP